MKRRGLALFGSLLVAATVTASQPTAPAHAQNAPFQVMETSIDDIHAAMKSGRLTAHQLVQAYLDRIASRVPMGRIGQPGEEAAAIVWLLSDEASFVTGAILDVTGGM